MNKTLTVRKAKEALQHLRKLTPANPKLDDNLEMSIKELVLFMAPDLIQMSKRGFTNKEFSDGLAAESVIVKPGTLNRYLNEYLSAKEEANKSEAGPETGKEETTTEAEKADVSTETSMDCGQAATSDLTPSGNSDSAIEDRQSDLVSGSPEISRSKSENLKPHSKGGREKSDSPPQNQGHPSPVSKE